MLMKFSEQFLYTTNEAEFDLFEVLQQDCGDETITELCNEAECDAFGN